MLDAMRLKVFEAALGGHNYLSAEARHEAMLAYLQTVSRISRYENQLKEIYANPEIENKAQAAAPVRRDLDLT